MTKLLNYSEPANDSLHNSASANEKGIVSIFNYNGAKVSFNKDDCTIMVNATEMAKPFGRKPSKWLELPSAKEFISALTEVRKSGNALIQTDRGGTNGGGCTWMHEDVALEFARWLSPTFAIWCNDRIKELLTKGISATEDTIDKILSNPDFGIKLLTQLKEERTARLEAEAKIKEDAPKVEYFNGLIDRGNNLNFRDSAKLLGVGEKAFIFMLIDKGYVYRDSKKKIKPIAKYVDKYFVLKEWNREENGKAGTQTLVTVKGREHFRSIIPKMLR